MAVFLRAIWRIRGRYSKLPPEWVGRGQGRVWGTSDGDEKNRSPRSEPTGTAGEPTATNYRDRMADIEGCGRRLFQHRGNWWLEFKVPVREETHFPIIGIFPNPGITRMGTISRVPGLVTG